MKFTSHYARYIKENAEKRGFTLIELMVSVSIFTIVMLISASAVFSIVDANKKTHSLKSVMTNLNFALESMMRDIRVGTEYACGGSGDCPINPGSRFSFKTRDLNGNGVADDEIEFEFDQGRIRKTIYPAATSFYITAEEIVITNLDFYVIGSGAGDGLQPKVVITIEGYSGAGRTRSDFNIQTTVSQRALDS